MPRNVRGVNRNVPQMPMPLADIGSLAHASQAFKQALDSLSGYRGGVLDRAVTFRDLIDLGLITQQIIVSEGATTNYATHTEIVALQELITIIYTILDGLRYIMSGGVDRTPSPDELLFDHACGEVSFVLPTGLPGSVGGIDAGGTSPSDDVVFLLYKDITQIGTMTIPGGATVGTNSAVFSFLADITFDVGDHFRLVAPHTPDETMRSPFYEFTASRV